MQVAQADVLRLVYYYGIGIRNVQTVLYDRRAEKHVIVPCHEVKYLVFKYFSLHLTMRYTYLHVRHKPVQDVMHRLKFLYPVVDEEQLSASSQFIIDYLLYLVVVEKHDFRLDRDPVWRRGIDDGKVAGSQKRELERSRDRSGRKSQSVHRCLELAELLLGPYSELLLLIDDEKSEVLEFKSLSYEFMSTYDYVKRTGLEPVLYVCDFLCSPQAAHIIYVAREVLKTAGECLEMLQGEDGRRHKDSNLLAVRNSLEGSADGDFSLSEAHITADKPVHRAVVLHVALDGLHCLFLVRSVLIHE